MSRFRFILFVFFALVCLGGARAFAVEVEVEVTGRGFAIFKGGEPALIGVSATVRWVKGDVLVKRAGAVVWEKVEAGMEFFRGDVVETREGASALLAVGDWSYVKASPMTSVTFQAAKSGGKSFRLVVLKSGKMWGSLKRVEEEEDPLVVQLPGGFVDGKETTFFVEADEKGTRGCIDMIRGEMNVRSSADPDQPVPLAKSTRAQIRPEEPIGEPEKIEEAVKENDMNHSCLAPEEKEEEEFAGREVAEEEEDASYVSVTGSVTVSFSGAGEMEEVKLGKEEEEEEARYAMVIGTAVVSFLLTREEEGLSDDDAIEFTMSEDDDEYEILEVTGGTDVKFEYAEGEEQVGDCVIGGVLIVTTESGIDVSGTTINANVCGSVTIGVKPSAITCSGGAGYDGWSLSVDGGTPATYGADAKAELTFDDATTFNLKLYAVNQAENKEYTPYTLSNVSFVKGSKKPTAGVTSVGGREAGDEKLTLDQDALDGGDLVVRGDAWSLLGCKIEKVLVSTDDGGSWSEATVSGDTWEYRFVPSEGTYNIKAKAVDEKDTESDESDPVEVEYAPGEGGDCLIAGISVGAVEPEGLEVDGTTVTSYACGSAKVSVEPSGISCSGTAGYDGWTLSVEGGSAETYETGAKAELTLDTGGFADLEMRAVDSAENKEHSLYSGNMNFVKSPESPVVNIKTVGGVEAGDEKLTLSDSSLEGSYLVVRGDVSPGSGCEITKVTVSTDDGGSWADATVPGDGSWEYRFVPSVETYYIRAGAEDAEGNESEEMAQAVEVEYYAEEAPGNCTIGGIEITAVEPDGLDVLDTAITQTVCGTAVVGVEPSMVSCDDNAGYDGWAFKVGGVTIGEYGVGDSAEWTPGEEGSHNLEMYLVDSAEGRSYDSFETTATFEKDMYAPEVTVTQVGNQIVEDESLKLLLYSDSLESGYIKVRVEAVSESECGIESVTVSEDEGGSYNEAEFDGALWTYDISPSDGATYYIMAGAKDEEGNGSDEMFQAIEAEYRHMRPEEELQNIFDQLIQAYLQKDTIGFMDLTDSAFYSPYEGLGGNDLLETSLDNKFAYETISLQYDVDTVTVSGDVGRVGFNWSADTTQYYGTFVFEKDTEWKFITVEDDNTFLRYTSDVAAISLSAGKTTLIADETDSTTITAEVWDSAQSHVKDGTEISFSATTGSISSSGTTTDGLINLTYTAGYTLGTATVTATSADGLVTASISLTLDPESAPPPPFKK